MKKLKIYSGVLILLLLMSSTIVFGQKSRTVLVGTMQHSPGEPIDDLELRWPQGWNNFEKEMSGDVNGIVIGTKMNWTDAQGVSWTEKIAQGISSKYTNIEDVIVPVTGEFKRYFKTTPPTKIIDGRNWTEFLFRIDPVDASIAADVVVYGHWTTWTGIDVERWTYSFVNSDYDDMVVVEWLFTNKSGELRPDTYFSVVTEMNTSSHYPGDLWSDYYGATYKEFAAGDATKDSLRIFYSWDADELGSKEDDKGNPDQIWGNFEEPQYMGLVCLHADKSVNEETDDPAQPHKAGWSQRELLPSLSETGHDEIYTWMSGPWDSRNPDLYTDASGFYRSLFPEWQAHVSNPVNEQAKPGQMHFGPYQMQDGDDVRIVVAYVAGSISGRLAIDAGRAYDSGYSGLKNVPMPYDVKDKDGNVLAAKGDLLTQEQKDKIIDTGRDSVLAVAGRAARLWKNANVRKGHGSFNIPMAPPSPSLTAESHPEKIDLKWGNEAEGTSGLAGYKIYRNYYRPPEVTIPTDTSFVLLKTVAPGTFTYEDTDIIRGQNYYYYVTAYTNDGVESSIILNRTGGLKSGQERIEEAVAPTRPPDPGWKNNVVVVPNPYHARARYKYESTKLNFLNTPAYCRIHIYTMTGDKVQTLYHNVDSGDESWDRQDTFSNMEIVSGIYLYVVEELDGPRGNATGETSIGKFVVVK